jgi:uncharacterized protein (TIGR02117 family)
MAHRLLPWPTRLPATWVRHLVRLVFVVCGLPLGLYACGAAPVVPAADASVVQAPTAYSVLVVNHGRHAGLLLRAGDVPAGAWPAMADFPDADYLEVGWGDRAYYMAAEPGAWLGLKAIAWPTPGVLHVVGVDTAPERFFPGAEILEIGVAPAGLQRLFAHLRQSHELDGAGRPITLGPGLYGHSRFYASREQFHLFKTCNVWVAAALQAAGVQVTPALTLSADRLMAQLRPLAKLRP